MTSHPIPARGETTPTCAECMSAHDLRLGCDEAAALRDVEPVTAALLSDLDSFIASYEDEWGAGDVGTETAMLKRIRAMLPALTSEVSALREAVDAFLAAHDDCEPGPSQTDEQIGRVYRAIAALRAARRDGAP